MNEVATVRRTRLEDETNGRTGILDAARTLPAEHNGSCFSLAEVANRSGCNIALVSYYFGGKEEMLLAILNDDQGTVLEPPQVLEASDISAQKKTQRRITRMVELHARRPYWNPLVHELLRRSEMSIARDIARRVVRSAIALQVKILEQGIAENVFRQVDPLAFYLHVTGGINMLMAARATLRSGFGINNVGANLRERFVEQTMSLLMDGLRQRNNSKARGRHR